MTKEKVKSQTEIRYHNLALSKLDRVLEFMIQFEQLEYKTTTTPTEYREMIFTWENKNEMRYKVLSKANRKIVAEGVLEV